MYLLSSVVKISTQPLARFASYRPGATVKPGKILPFVWNSTSTCYANVSIEYIYIYASMDIVCEFHISVKICIHIHVDISYQTHTHIPLYLLHIHVCMNFRKRWRFTQSRCPSAVKVFPGGSTSTSRTNLRSMWPLTSENSSNPQTSSIVGGRESRQHNPTHTHNRQTKKY